MLDTLLQSLTGGNNAPPSQAQIDAAAKAEESEIKAYDITTYVLIAIVFGLAGLKFYRVFFIKTK